ncbi:MAG TPA: NifB/NifX family molybdenum-iron cluster-binding protein [Myxococcota bacterium]|nr:NifB/NifX family molybdenum-iron cluster-binding protein [Myxococcota bacterium]
MQVAITVWNQRVSPLFDSARTIFLLKIEGGHVMERSEVSLDITMPHYRVQRLHQLGVDVLICGAISRPLAVLCASTGIELIPWVAGELDRVIEAFITNSLPDPVLTMPGCRRRLRNGRRRGGGMGRGRGRGHRQGKEPK